MRIVFSIIFCFLLFFNTAFAAFPDANVFIRKGMEGDNLTSTLVGYVDPGIGEGLEDILKLLYNVGVVVGVCIPTFIGVKMIISSPQQKAQMKASIFPYLVGLLLFVAGVPIAILIINIFIKIF